MTKFYRLQGQILMILTKFDSLVKILRVKSADRPFGNLKGRRVISRVKWTSCLIYILPLLWSVSLRFIWLDDLSSTITFKNV
jgi:hypothetical protein